MMKLTSLDIPNDPAAWPAWLEGHLVGTELGDLAAELRVLVGDQDTKTRTLDDVLGTQAAAVLESGLGVLDDHQIAELLKHPYLLLALQERILIEGGEHWQRVPLAEEHRREAEADWKRVEAALAEPPAVTPRTASGQQSEKRSWGVRRTILAIVAAFLVVAFGMWATRPAPSGWGFERSGLLTANLAAPEYLHSLAAAADDWFNQRPATSESLAERLREFRAGCDTLIAAPHPQLSPEDRVWLIERCRAWREKIDGHLDELAQNPGNVPRVREQADQTVNKLKAALTARAAAIS